jgi:hypothetical protein
MRVRWHAFDREAVEVTRFVTDAQWSVSIFAPWESASLTMRMREDQAAQVFLDRPYTPVLGDWVSIHDDADALVFWGSVSRIGRRESADPSGALSIPFWSVTLESWFSALARHRIYVAPGLKNELQVTARAYIIDSTTWGDLVSAWLTSFGFEGPGSFLASLWKTEVGLGFPLIGMRAPETLGAYLRLSTGGALAFSDVPIVYDPESALDKAVDRQGQMLPILGNSLASLQSARPGGSVIDMVRNSFSGDANLIEMFPSLEVGGDGKLRPALIYRLRPLLLEPLRRLGGEPEAQPLAAERTGLFQTPVSIKPGLNPTRYELRRVYALNGWEWSEDSRINTVVVNSAFASNSPQALGLVARPVVDGPDVARHGARMLEVDWPFVPRYQEDEAKWQSFLGAAGVKPSTTVRDFLESLGELAATFNGRGEELISGSISVAFDPALKAGHWFTAQVGAGFWLTAYAQAMSHSLQVDNNGVSAGRTSITFIRGDVTDAPWQPARPRYRRVVQQ